MLYVMLVAQGVVIAYLGNLAHRLEQRLHDTGQ